jgi:hypothetical protein
MALRFVEWRWDLLNGVEICLMALRFVETFFSIPTKGDHGTARAPLPPRLCILREAAWLLRAQST